jgi:MYXO-CTERM domain-containing protein
MPGMRVTPGDTAAYQIELRGSDWWLSYNGQDLGYFPGSLWPATRPYSAAGYVQWFGEIAAGTMASCSEMGNGSFGNQTGASSMTGLYKIAPGGQHVAANASIGRVTNPASWNVGQMSATAFSFGGPGYRGGGCCTPQSCAEAMAQCGQPADSCGAPLACGVCDNGNACSVDFSCASPAPDGAEQLGPDGGNAGPDSGNAGPDGTGPLGPDGDPSTATAGCCQTGQGARPALLPALGVLLALRRRRRRAR